MRIGVFCKSRGLTCQSIAGSQRLGGHRNRGRDREDDAPREGPEVLRAAGPYTVPPGHASSIDHSSEVSLEADLPVDSIYAPNTILAPADVDVTSPEGTASFLSGSRVYTLEDGISSTAHSMGIAAEQDPYLLTFFRAIIIDETDRVHSNVVQVSPGDSSTGLVPVHFTLIKNDFPHHDNQIRDEASNEIESKAGPYGPNLVNLYFKHVHPAYCVVSKTRFLRAYRKNKLSIPASLRGIIYGLAAVFWNEDPLLKEAVRPFEQHELFIAARASLERELDSPNLWKMQACLLILHEAAPSYWSHETPRTWTLSAQALACAQEIGLHRDPGDWKISQWEKSLRKKLWWATYMTDIWSSIANGNPTHIYPASYTTSDLSMSDLEFDEDVPEDLQDMVHPASHRFETATAARFLEHVKLSQLTHRLLDTAL